LIDEPIHFDTDIHSGMKPLDKHWEWWMERPTKGPPLTKARISEALDAIERMTKDEALAHGIIRSEDFPQKDGAL